MTEHDADPKEIAEAEALRRALEGEASSGPFPQDALAAANLLRAAGPAASLDPGRAEEILRTVVESAPPPAVRPWFIRFRWLVPAGAAAGLLAVFLLWPAVRRSPSGPVPLPAPPRELLLAQARAARGGSLAALDGAMSGYRGAMFDSLSARYSEER